jgi:S-DNA-T family DNA segregation ATPase FtsK/SpoIIIE
MAANRDSSRNQQRNRKQSYQGKRSGRAYTTRGKAPVGTSGGALGRFFTSRWLWRALGLAVILGLLFWQKENINAWVERTARGTFGWLGWGLLLLFLALLLILVIIFRKTLAAFIKTYKLYLWHVWLGAVVIFAAIWGVLGLFDLGGVVGRRIVGDYAFLNILRVLGLFLLGAVLIAPRASWRVFKSIGSGLVGLFTPPPRPKSASQAGHSPYMPVRPAAVPPAGLTDAPKPRHSGGVIMGRGPFGLFTRSKEQKVQPAVQIAPAEPPEERPVKQPAPAREPKTEASKNVEASSGQVARDVWRKYGESDSVPTIDGWKIPPIEILDKAQEIEFSDADNKLRAKIIEDALGSYGVNARVVQINVGPTVTQFGVEPGWDIKTRRVQERDKDGNSTVREEEVSRTRVKVDRITSLSNDLALALSAPTIRIEAPVPGKPIVGLEVPNKVYSTVTLRSVIESNAFQKLQTKSKLSIALGKGAGGEAISDDLAKMPHLLIAGSTGSGKTVCLNAIICCLLMNNTPFDTKMIMIDPKRVELTPFNSMPHLAAPVIVDTDKALSVMRWLSLEMDNRYKRLAAAQTRNIEGFNKTRTGAEKMPNLVLVIDELADLMMAGFDEVEHILCRLAQLARAVGIHLVVATQRPSVDVITGLIKANFPTRISFAVTSQVDSRTILDMVGAEKLLGRGDMLYAPTEAAKPKRLQGCYVSDQEVERLVYFWNSQQNQSVTQLKIEDIAAAAAAAGQKGGPPADPLMESVRELAKEHKQISASFIQRKLNVGYPRAARLYDRYKEEAETGDDGGAEVPPEEV